MGKKVRKTRWRTLPIADEISDSEDSSTNPPTSGVPRWNYQKLPPPGRFLSQPGPRRRYDCGSTDMSTRSSSTTSENKITFNEDEYTKITTPRQDVLFKKGYLNKPRTYQTQTSTGTSNTSTGNSTGNGTPDHQSTDVEYESQFMFPNGFVDQNGIYYVNSYETYPLMLYNPSTTYYQDYNNVEKKRYSTGSLTESTSPNTEEATSQEHSQTGSEAPVSLPDFSQHQYYNMVYPGYFVNGVCPPGDVPNGQDTSESPKRIKKRRRRKTSTSENTQEDTSECTDEETPKSHPLSSLSPASSGYKIEETPEETTKEHTTTCDDESTGTPTTVNAEEAQQSEETTTNNEITEKRKYDLKPDAQEFIPRAYRNRDLPPIPVKLVPPNFVPIPLLPVREQAFIQQPIPVNFFPGPAPGYVSFVPPQIEMNNESVDQTSENVETTIDITEETQIVTQSTQINKNAIDIASVVSKLEEAVKEQEESQKNSEDIVSSSPKFYPRNQRYKNNFNRRKIYKPKTPHNSGEQTPTLNENKEDSNLDQNTRNYVIKNSPQRFKKNWKQPQNTTLRKYATNSPITLNGSNTNDIKANKPLAPTTNYSDLLKKSSEPKQSTLPIYEKQISCPPKIESTVKETKIIETSKNITTTHVSKPNQWISVSSKKKRKGKSIEDIEDSFESEETLTSEHVEEFESYDINQLVDVVPVATNDVVSKNEDIVESTTKITTKSATTEEESQVQVVQSEVENILTTIIINGNISNQDDVDSSLKIPEVSEIEKELINNNNKSEDIVERGVEVILDESKVEDNVDEIKNKTKNKKAKKSNQKMAVKRVIITDVDLSGTFSNNTPEISDEKVIQHKEKKVVTVDTNSTKEIDISEVSHDKKSTSNTNKKKKKKQQSKQSTNTNSSNEQCSVDTVQTPQEESYDFLLDTSILNESTEKTNDEISQELDKIIQKGMFSSFEGKIKELNIEPSDDFFKTILSLPKVSEKPPFAGAMFQRQPLKPVSVREESTGESHGETKSNENHPDGPAHGAKSGYFLETEETQALHPITEAVKQWMVRTRENTPDVEILKSPSEIIEDMCASSESDSETSDDDVVLYEKDGDMCSKGCANGDADVLEPYESSYGHNEDFLNIKREVQAQTQLPYRKVCCSLQ